MRSTVSSFRRSPSSRFFSEQGWTPACAEEGPYRRFSHGDLHLYQGDFFAAWQLEQRYRLVYDRASLIALPAPLRLQYAQQLARMVVEGGEILLVTVEYQPDPQREPPFSVSELEVRRLFEPHFAVTVLGRQREGDHPRVASGQLSYFDEVCYRLVRRANKTLPPLI
ncbi:thiopurine S-methyltransferase [Aeromonas diversa CDC 2478-85]|uniref:Thiopurine S-methyltransferase n=1 Tax=Aeromonas diversa CDC 2478-85 TaxID=1268237 RepID=N9VAH5_9GAMM|nr:thiopurine S-methyltransferase [Aeromonas diversa CDC 2478-85]